MSGQPLPDHIGWDLLRAAKAWEDDFTTRMVQAGHPWFGEARGKIIRHVGSQGIAQSDLPDRAGMTKQAVGQHLDDLEADGILTRVPDPEDSRKRRVVFTDAGRAAVDDANRIKLEIEANFASHAGEDGLEALRSSLKRFLEAEDRQVN